MLRAAIAFFVMGISIFLLSIYNLAGVSEEAGKLFLLVFLAFSVFSLVAAVTVHQNSDKII
ncbi:MAG: DUF1328 domain-containing protein [Bacteriovoracia bacterium]